MKKSTKNLIKSAQIANLELMFPHISKDDKSATMFKLTNASQMSRDSLTFVHKIIAFLFDHE